MIKKKQHKVKAKEKVAGHKNNSETKKQSLMCEDCGLVLSVDEVCDCVDLSGVMCCGEPMKEI